MPTPLEVLLDPVSLFVIAMYIGLMVWEAIFPARPLSKVKYWKLKGLTAFGIFFYLSSYLPLLTDPYLEPYRLLDLTGLGTAGGALVGVLLYELGVYIKTPQWAGYLIQRPEGHTVHHAKGIHKYNYSDVSIFDIISGTFYNPKGHEYDTGFYQGATGKIKDMLLFRDINKQDSENAGTTLEPMQKRAYQL